MPHKPGGFAGKSSYFPQIRYAYAIFFPFPQLVFYFKKINSTAAAALTASAAASK